MKRRRTYDARSRRQAAEATRHAILAAARRAFIKKGYAGTTMPTIARDAGIALDTVYATVGKKPALFRLLIETAISGTDQTVPAQARDYVRDIQAEPDAAAKLRLYAAALRRIHRRLAPLLQVLRSAAAVDNELNALWDGISRRRARNMRIFAKDLAATEQLRIDLSIDMVADILWSMNSPEFYLLLVDERGWSPAVFEQWLGDAWRRLLLDPLRV